MNKNKSHLEIERKFLIKEIPLDLHNYKYSVLKQGYISAPGDHSTVRVRKMDQQYLMTVKGKSTSDGLSRKEVEFPISEENFEALWVMTDERQINKRRYYIPWENHSIELDIFESNLKGLILAEIEFDSESDAKEAKIPHWFDRELTRDYRYSNSALATHGLPKE